MRYIFIISLSCLFYLNVQAQPGKEAWHWFFGTKCKIDFSSGVPVVGVGIPTGYFPVSCASVSDENTGQYLFTVGATKIYNKNNVAMYNGYNLLANYYSSQDLIVPKPGNANIYYVITPDIATPTNHGVNYSVVDMSLQGGLGAVTLKNQLLTPPPTTEKVTAVKHCNGTDYWIITHPANTNAFNSYLLTASGINTTPLVSYTGVSHQYLHFNSGGGGFYWEGEGCLKASPNGKKLASAIQSDSIPILEIFDFDNSTGIVSNPIAINYPGILGPFGTSFSPDNSKLYSIPYNNFSTAFDTAMLYQYDLSSGVPAAIVASQTLIYLDINTWSTWGLLGNLQIAPDGKIYISKNASDTIAVINNPNALGAACNFQKNGLVLPSTTTCQWGISNFIDANYAGINLNIPDIQLCNTFTPDTLDAGPGFVNYFWSTGASTQTITVSNPGKYWVTVTSAQGCTKTDTVNAYLLKPLKSDTIYCGPAYTANVTQGGVLAYNWYDANNNPIRNFTQSGTYWVDISYINGCAIRDSIILTIFPAANVNIGPDSTFCLGNLTLNALNPTANYLWSTGEITQSINATKAGTYWVIITDTNGCKAKDTMIVRPQLSAFNFVMPNIVTPNNDNINDVIDFSIYQFSTFHLEIYNRWGQKLFECSEPNCLWKPSGEDGTYFYTAQYKIECGADAQTKEIKGYIQVLR